MIRKILNFFSVWKSNSIPPSKKVAHFLLLPELLYSPPNNAIIKAYLHKGYNVDIYSPGIPEEITLYGNRVKTYKVSYSWLWLLRNFINLKWLRYYILSGTSEDPLAIVAIISFTYKKASFALVDEIKAGSYRGDRSEYWKRICRWGIRRANFRIVNDEYRIDLLRDYASLQEHDRIIVYPGCFFEPPKANNYLKPKKEHWGFPSEAFVIGSSGGFNLTAGADWLLNSIRDMEDIYGVIQPLGVTPLSMFLMESLECRDRLFIQKERLGWLEAWKIAAGFDIGLSIYTNPAPQFQKMGISSNRLCMLIAMGVPVIASVQESFTFLEEYDCGILVESFDDFKLAIQEIRTKHNFMKDNCKKCLVEYIRPKKRFETLLQNLDLLIDK